jgi:tRNA dimethylallyltransferase
MPPSPDEFRDAYVLTGPTGSGKTALALDLAERLNAEIIAMDSMTLYRGMDIGTAKPTPAERSRVPHHLIDVLEPGESASVAWYLQRAAACVADIRGRGKRALFVGGTPFYLKAMLFGLFEAPAKDEDLRRRLEAEAARDGAVALHARLAAVDPETAGRLHPNDVRRVVRALEVYRATGKPISALQVQWPALEADAGRPPVLCLDLPRPVLYARIDRRVEAMIAAGWLDEVRRLRRRPIAPEPAQALGYAELGWVLDGVLPLIEAVPRIQQRSRNFAKRQLTWFRRFPGLQLIPPELTTALRKWTIG